MMLARVISAALLKLKRTNAARLVLIAPFLLVVLLTFLFSQAPGMITRQRGDHWVHLTNILFFMWVLLVLPLYIAVQTALVAALEHAENQWKLLLARPIPRWTIYLGKLCVVIGFLVISSAVLALGVCLSGTLLRSVQPELRLGPVPYSDIFAKVGQTTLLAYLPLTIQHWIAVRCRSFSAAVGIGIVAMITGYIVAILASRNVVGWTRYFPWTLPAMAMVVPPVPIEPLLWLSCIAGSVIAALACLDFSRRDAH
jgi:hypothetical protein